MTDTIPTEPTATPADAPGATPRGRKAAVGFIFTTALIDIISIGIIIPVLPPLVVHFVGDPARGAQLYGFFGASFALMQFFVSPLQGALSDRFGRRPVLLASIFGLGCDFVFMALAPGLVWLFIGRMIGAATAASFSTANAYIADLNVDEPSPQRRAARFGLMATAFGVGFVLGPSIGGLLGHFGPRAPFWGAACLSLINWLYGFFVLPESLPKERRAPFRFKSANPVASLKLYGVHPLLPRFALITALLYLAQQVYISSFVLYMGYRYHFGPELIGASLAATGVGSIVVQMFVIAPFVKRFGQRAAIYTGLVCGALAFTLYASASQPWMYWSAVPLSSMAGLIMPGVQAVMTRRVPRDMQGRLQGANASLMAMAGLIGPIAFTSVFAWSISGGRQLPGLTIYIAAALYVVAFVIALGTPKLDETQPA